MSWIRIDDGFSDHPKILAAGPYGVTVLLRAVCWSSRHLTDGYIPDTIRSQIFEGMNGFGPENMVQCGLWELAEGGWQVHDYLHFNPSKKEVLRRREETAKRVREWRRSRNAVTNSVSNAVSNAAPVPAPFPSPTPVSVIKKKRQGFVKPTLEEVEAFITEKGLSVDPVAWYSFYESNGWRVGRNPMVSWRGAVWTWERKARQE